MSGVSNGKPTTLGPTTVACSTVPGPTYTRRSLPIIVAPSLPTNIGFMVIPDQNFIDNPGSTYTVQYTMQNPNTELNPVWLDHPYVAAITSPDESMSGNFSAPVQAVRLTLAESPMDAEMTVQLILLQAK